MTFMQCNMIRTNLFLQPHPKSAQTTAAVVELALMVFVVAIRSGKAKIAPKVGFHKPRCIAAFGVKLKCYL